MTEEAEQVYGYGSGQIDRRRAERRRALAQTIHNARNPGEKSEAQIQGFALERQFLFSDIRLNSAYAVPLLAFVVAGISILWYPPLVIVLWLSVTLMLHFVMVFTCRAYERTKASKRRSRSWPNRFVAGDFVYACSWAAFFLLPTRELHGPGLQVFLFATMLIVLAMNTMQSATLPRALMAGTLPVSLTMTASLLRQPEITNYTLAAMALGAQGFFFILANQLLKNANTMLDYRAAKDHLIAELETANSLSDEARRRAEEANLAKSRFLATMSHELRTPLNAVLGFSEVMKDEIFGPMGNKAYKDYAVDIHTSGAHLLNLINEILDLSRIEAGRHELQEESLYLPDIVEECCNMMQIRAQDKSIALLQKFPDTLPKVWGDERALRQVVLNLMSNAVKFTPENGTVTVSMTLQYNGDMQLCVHDTGPGIPEEEIPVVLQAFGQGSIAIKSAEPGSGLGLSIVQALVSMHGGAFTLASGPEGGTRASFTLPAKRVLQPLPDYEQQPRPPRPDGERRSA